MLARSSELPDRQLLLICEIPVCETTLIMSLTNFSFAFRQVLLLYCRDACAKVKSDMFGVLRALFDVGISVCGLLVYNLCVTACSRLYLWVNWLSSEQSSVSELLLHAEI